jgi:type IV pilus assembly protein PilO
MFDIWEKILSRPKPHQIGMWIALLVVVTYLFWTFSLSSYFEQYSKATESLTKLESQLSIETIKLRNLPALRRELEQYTVLNQKALEMLPKKGQVEGLLDSVSDLAQRSGLNVSTFIPRPEIKRQFYAEIPIDMDMSGSFHQVVTFLDELSRESRIVNVQDIILDNPRGYTNDSGVDVDVKVILKTFRYLEPHERPQPSKDSKGKTNKKAS